MLQSLWKQSPSKSEDLQYKTFKPDPEDLPPNWEFYDYKAAGIDVGCIRAHAKGEPKSKITLISGFKANIKTYNTPQIRALQKIGIEIDIILLPDPGKKIGYLQDNKEIAKQVLTHNPPPDSVRSNIPHFIFGHSLGGRAFIANMRDEEFAQEILENYTGAVLIAPHFSSPYRSRPLVNAIYSSYCKMFAEKSYGDAPLDWTMSAANKFKEMIKSGGKDETRGEVYQQRSRATYSPITTDNTATTHGQILYSNQEGEDLWQRIQDKGVPDAAKEFPMIMMGGSKDFVSCQNYIRNVAEAFDAEFYEFDTYHHPFLESKRARKLILNLMQKTTDNWQNMNVPTDNALIRAAKRATGVFKEFLSGHKLGIFTSPNSDDMGISSLHHGPNYNKDENTPEA